MNQLVATETGRGLEQVSEGNLEDFVTFVVADQMFGVQVLNVQDILRPENIAAVPLAPPEVKGSINLRGRIVTVIDVRVRLGLPEREAEEGAPNQSMGVTVEHENELYNLMVDDVGEVLSLAANAFETVPGTLDPKWREFAGGVYQLEDRLMVILDIEKMLALKS